MKTLFTFFAGAVMSCSAGCGSRTPLDLGDDAGYGLASPGGPDDCSDPPPFEPAPQLDFRAGGPGRLIEDHLHLQGTVDGEPVYLVAQLDQGALWVEDTSSALRGTTRWVQHAAGQRYVRMRPRFPDEVGIGANSMVLEVLDATVPGAPTVLRASTYEGTLTGGQLDSYAVVDDRLYVCRLPAPDAVPQLATVHLLAPAGGPGAMVPAAFAGPCAGGSDRVVAEGDLLFGWTEGTGPGSGTIQMTNLRLEQSVVSFSFVPDGIHAYGGILAAAADGERLVVSPENDDWALVFDDAGATGPDGPYVPFSPAGPKRLLTVVDHIAYFATPDGVVGYDYGQIGAPALLETTATAAWDPDELTFVASSESDLYVHDADGLLWRAPRGVTAPASPVPIYLGSPVELPNPCD